MSFHPQKYTVIRIATNQRHVIPTQYTLHGHTLEVVNSAKYLGVTISEDLQWSNKRASDEVVTSDRSLINDKKSRVPGLYLEVLLRVFLSRKTLLHLGAPAVSGYR
jgi:hypothetical protein